MHKKAIYFLIGLLFISISINLYQFINKTVTNNKMSKQVTNLNTIKDDEDVEENNKDKLYKNNPIDKFFDKHEMTSSTTAAMINYSSLYCEQWEAEMKHAYGVLIKAGHKNIKPIIKDSQNSFVKYAKSEAELAASIDFSSAFVEEESGDDITYGSFAPITINDTLAELYKNKTIEIFNNLNLLDIKIDFIFNEKNLSKEELMILE